MLLEAGLDPNIRGGNSKCPLIFGAIENSDLETVTKLKKELLSSYLKKLENEKPGTD